MPFDTNSPWMSGGLALSVIGYGLFSAFISGPEILTREAHKADWNNQCRQEVVAELRHSQPQPNFQPQVDYRGMMRGLFGHQAGPMMRMFEPLNQIADQAQQHARNIERMNEERLRQRAESAGSRCACAVTMLSENRISLGLYAGSGRLITPTIFKDLPSELNTALHSSRCQITYDR